MFKVFGKMFLIGLVLLGCSHDENFDELRDDISELRRDITEEEPVEPKLEKRWLLVSDRKSIASDLVTVERKFEITGGQFEIMWGISNHPKYDISRAVISLYKENGTLLTRIADTSETEIGILPFSIGPGSYYLKITYEGVLYVIIREYR